MADGGNTTGHLTILDYVQIPKGLKAGKYVLGWRYDCEESNQAS